jgi:hypothetical protein
MDLPKFPKDFMLQHCPKVLEERRYRLRYTGERNDEDDLLFAECAFYKAGMGLTCESCDLHVSPYCRDSQDACYQSIANYYKACQELEEEERRNSFDLGAGI